MPEGWRNFKCLKGSKGVKCAAGVCREGRQIAERWLVAINLSLVLRCSATKSDESRQIKVKLATPATPTQLCSSHKHTIVVYLQVPVYACLSASVSVCVGMFALLLNISFPLAQVELRSPFPIPCPWLLGMQNEALPVSGLFVLRSQ